MFHDVDTPVSSKASRWKAKAKSRPLFETSAVLAIVTDSGHLRLLQIDEDDDDLENVIELEGGDLILLAQWILDVFSGVEVTGGVYELSSEFRRFTNKSVDSSEK